MKYTLTFVTLMGTASMANANIGHLGELAGHDHWLALGALGIAIGFAGWAALGGKKDDDAVDTEEDPEAQEA